MASTISESLITSGAVLFSFRDGTRGTIAPDDRRIYDHIIRVKVGHFPSEGLTDAQVKFILSASRLANDELEGIWQRTETIDAPGLPDGHWTKLEIYVTLHFLQASERLSANQMAIQFAGSAPSEPTYGIRRRSSYADAGLSLRPATNHDPMPAFPSPAPTAFPRHSVSNATKAIGITDRPFDEATSDQGGASLSQPGLELLEPFHVGTSRHLRGNEVLRHTNSVRTDVTIGPQRLASLIQSRCPNVQIDPKIERTLSGTVQSSTVDKSHAHDMLVRIRHQDPKATSLARGLTTLFKSQKSRIQAADSSTWIFKSHELSLALREAVEEFGKAGVANQLICMGADINDFKSKIRGSRVQSIPINYAQIAVNRNDADMLSLLATSGISQSNLVGALERSVEQNLPNMVTILLQHGVDPNAANGSIFTSAITSQSPVLVRLLLRSRPGIRKELLSRNLPTAVEHGEIEIVSLLVAYGADPGFGNASALRRAVKAQRIDLALAIFKGVEGSLSSKIATSVIGEAFSATSSITVDEQSLLLEILLIAGASGDPVAQVLASAVRAGQQSLAKLLIRYHANVQFNNAEALRIALSANNLAMLSTLLLGKIEMEVASRLVDEIPHTCNDDQIHSILSLFIRKGAKGSPLSRALVYAVQRKSVKSINLLLDHGASVEFDGSQPIQRATTGGDTQILNLLLSKGQPSPRSLQVVLPVIPESPLQLRFEMTKSIINAAGRNGIAASVLDDSLLSALSRPSHEFNQFLIPLVEILITAGARVDYKRGKFFRLAAEFESMELLELLIHNTSQPTSLSPAVRVCMKIQESKKRQKLIGILLEHGAKGLEVNQALIDAVEERSIDPVLIKSLLGRADLDYLNGRAIVSAMRHNSVEVVKPLIDTGRLSRKTCLEAVQVLFEPDTGQRQAKLSLLLQTDIGQQGLDNALIQEISGERDGKIIEMLLDHQASCEHDWGKSLELAIHCQDFEILRQLIAKRPDHRVLEALVPKAMELKSVHSRRASLSLLLEGGATSDCLCSALVREVETPGYRDHQIIQLLVENGARIDYLDARAIKFAVSSPLDVGVLGILVTGTAASAVVAALIPLAMEHDQKDRMPILQLLLQNGAHGAHVSAALVTAVSEGANAQPTIDLLLEHDASVNENEGEAIRVAALAASSSVLKSLLDRNPNPAYFDGAINLAMQSLSSNSEAKAHDRLQCVRLLTQSNTPNSGAINTALVQAVQEVDHHLIKHLTNSGADPNFRDGASVIIATQQLNTRSLHLLTKSKIKPTMQTCCRAFSVLPHDQERWRNEADAIYTFDSILIFAGATGPAVDQTFLSAIHSSHTHAAKFISVVLKCKTALNVNFQHGGSLRVAVRRALLEVVDYLLLQRPDELILHSAFMAMFESNVEEHVLITLAQRFFEHSNGANHIYFRHNEPADNALYQTLHRHGDKPTLLQLLLANGCGVDSRFSWTFDNSIGAEDTSPLLWLLCQGNQSINSLTVDTLLERGADPNFRTHTTHVTPLMMAASSPNGDITLRLLEAGAYPDTQDCAERTPLQYATMANNVKGMDHLLKHDAEVNDESLHIAARQLDLSAVDLLLAHHARTDLPGTVHCGGRTPLGELCRMADLSENPAQLIKTLKLLCKATKSFGVLTDGRSCIFQALDNHKPLQMTAALLKSCQAVNDEINNDYNILVNGSLCYSPSAYVRHFKCIEPSGVRSVDLSRRCCGIDACPAPQLERLLHAHGCQDRFWDGAAGANQPRGFCNPPFAIIASIKDAEAARREQDRKARARAEEMARKEQEQRELDEAAAANSRRERERIRALEEVAAAEIRATKKKAEAEAQAIQQRTAEKEKEIRRLKAVEDEEAEARRKRELAEQNHQLEQERLKAKAEDELEAKRDRRREQALRERTNIQLDQKKREADIQQKVFKEERNLMEEKRKFMNDARNMFIEANHAGGVTRAGMGRILGEIEQ